MGLGLKPQRLTVPRQYKPSRKALHVVCFTEKQNGKTAMGCFDSCASCMWAGGQRKPLAWPRDAFRFSATSHAPAAALSGF